MNPTSCLALFFILFVTFPLSRGKHIWINFENQRRIVQAFLVAKAIEFPEASCSPDWKRLVVSTPGRAAAACGLSLSQMQFGEGENIWGFWQSFCVVVIDCCSRIYGTVEVLPPHHRAFHVTCQMAWTHFTELDRGPRFSMSRRDSRMPSVQLGWEWPLYQFACAFGKDVPSSGPLFAPVIIQDGFRW